MGDMAEMELGEILDPSGVSYLDESEYYNPKEDGHPGNYPFSRSYPATLPRSKNITCRRCKTPGLRWGLMEKPYGRQWRLGFYTGNGAWKEHRCEDHGWTSSKSNKTCRYCGRSGLQWTKHEGGWRLAEEDGGIHTCEEYSKGDCT